MPSVLFLILLTYCTLTSAGFVSLVPFLIEVLSVIFNIPSKVIEVFPELTNIFVAVIVDIVFKES